MMKNKTDILARQFAEFMRQQPQDFDNDFEDDIPAKNDRIKAEADKTVVGSLKFSQHMAQFSKLVSFIFIILYGVTWAVYLGITIKMYFDTGVFDIHILDFILQPMLVILGFYYSTKALENIFNIVTSASLKRHKSAKKTEADDM